MSEEKVEMQGMFDGVNLKAVGFEIAIPVYDMVVDKVFSNLVKDSENTIDDAIYQLVSPLIRAELIKMRDAAKAAPAE